MTSNKLLIVDDNPLDRRIAAACVEAEGMAVEFAENGRQALDVIKDFTPDVVLTDMDMPEMDGLELVREVKQTYPTIPVILMTAKGSEEIAVTALKTGASSYVPKRNLKRDLASALSIVLDVARSRQQRQQVFDFMVETETKFVLGYDPVGPGALVSYFQDGLRMLNFCDEGELLRVGTALSEALANSLDHGNLELDSALREEGDGRSYRALAKERAGQAPYKDRRVHVTARMANDQAVYSIRDEGPGFDPSTLPDPTDPENLMRPHGRGLMLISTFMDDVRFNDTGNEITMIKRRTVV